MNSFSIKIFFIQITLLMSNNQNKGCIGGVYSINQGYYNY